MVQEVSGSKPVQEMSIHLLSLPKISQYFRINDDPPFEDLIERIVMVYNQSVEENNGNIYREVVIKNPNWPLSDFVPFKIKLFVHNETKTTHLAAWVKSLSGKDFEVKKTSYLFFLFRSWMVEEKLHRELFALTTEHAWRVVQSFCDYKFPAQIARRLSESNLTGTTNRPVVGPAIQVTAILKFAEGMSSSQNLDKFVVRSTLKFRADASIFNLSIFRTKKGEKRKRGCSAEIGMAMVRLNKDIAPNTYPAILDHFSKIARGNETFLAIDGPQQKENDSTQLDFLDRFQQAPLDLSQTLSKTMIVNLAGAVYQGKGLLHLDICHKFRTDYYRSPEFSLQHNHQKIGEWEGPPSALDVVEALKEFVNASQTSQQQFLQNFKNFTFSYMREGKIEKGPLLSFLEGEARIKDKGTYWRLHNIWYWIRADYLSEINKEFGKLIKESLIEQGKPGFLPHLWPSPTNRANRKAELGEKRYKIEAEYNQTYMEKENFILGDEMLYEGIELYDLLQIQDKKTYLYQVKEGLDQHTRDACSQIRNAANILQSRKMHGSSDVVRSYYQSVMKEGKNQKAHAKVKTSLARVSEDEFIGYFSKKIVFVYAFADQGISKRLLSQEPDRLRPIKPGDLEPASKRFKGEEVHSQLVEEKYLTSEGRPTAKLYETSLKTFSLSSIPTKIANTKLRKTLAEFESQFDSTIAKLELIRLRDDLRGNGHDFKITQIMREDYPESQSTQQEIDMPLTDSALTEIDLEGFEGQEELSFLSGPKEGGQFKFENYTYQIFPTEGDGACGLHALLGSMKNGKYSFLNARSEFLQRLKRGYKEVEQQWITLMKEILKQAHPNRYEQSILDKIPQLLNDVRDSLTENLNEQKDVGKQRDDTLTTILTISDKKLKKSIEQELGTNLSQCAQYPAHFISKCHESLENLIRILANIEIGKKLAAYQDDLERLEGEREELYIAAATDPALWDGYLKAAEKESYYFSDLEIGMAAILFKKGVVIYTHLHTDIVDKSLEMGNSSKPIVIFHKGMHYSRCG